MASLGDDVVGVRWVNDNKAWIPNPVAEWILKTYPDLLPNHGWFTWADVSGDARTCVCKQPLPDRDERYHSLLIHVAEMIAERLIVEERDAERRARGWSSIESKGAITWVDADGVQYTIDNTTINIRKTDE